MRKKALSAVIILALTVAISSNAFASSNELKQTQDNKVKLQTKVEQLNTQINSTINKIDKNKEDMNKIANSINSAEKNLKVAENSSKAQSKLFNKRARAMYMTGIDGYLEVLLNSSDINDFISRVDTISKVMKFDKDVLDKLKNNQEAIAAQKQSLITENNRLQSLRESNESTLSKLNTDISAQKQLLASESKKEQNLLAEENTKKLALNTNTSTNSSNSVAKHSTTSNNAVTNNLSRGSSGSLSSSKSISVNATAYCDSGITASGMSTRKGVIAVDPRVIPLGSKVYIDGYGYAIAADTGGAIVGNRIDLFFPSKTDAQNWGMRPVTVHILN